MLRYFFIIQYYFILNNIIIIFIMLQNAIQSIFHKIINNSFGNLILFLTKKININLIIK